MSAPRDPAHAPIEQLAAWRAVAGLTHAFFGRRGGTSAGAWASLNLSERVGDDPAAVAANWQRVGDATPGVSIVRMRQVHGARLVKVDSGEQRVGEADGLLTDQPGVGLAVLTADCVPLLFAAPQARALMAVHAGWRGTLAGIAAAALAEGQRAFGARPADWQVAIGPAIDACCYEVEAELGGRMVDRWGAMPDAWHPGTSHGRLDLRGVNRHILLENGVPVEEIATVGGCTACHDRSYFSHRRAGGRTGRQLSLIAWTQPA
jgi:purine-nucleoside/S-methyl-5'-thioadenosine phosphorylase / adenosine deaminase